MEQNHTPITEFDTTLIADFFGRIPRQGPGSEEATLLALRHIGPLPANAQIADIGCGTGGQTFALARNTQARITAVDIMPEFVTKLNERARQEGFERRIAAIEASMETLPFAPETFDLIWSEGAIDHIGFERGMNEWRRYLRPGGHIAVTVFSWLTPERPDAIEKYSADNGIAPLTVTESLRVMEQAGYRTQAHFVLPSHCWTDNYYRPMNEITEPFLDDHRHSEAARFFVERIREEMDLYDRYGNYFGYIFYIGYRD